ncbi:MAG: Ig-like domain-containing protein [Candidatus Methanomethylophilaceae archaeon]|nr:Ig-like domain-containing protein [Candidatus Methanomethylophilaceae archaeon]
MNGKIAALIAAIIIIAAGAGAFLLLKGDEKHDAVGNAGGRLQIYGNANNDDYMNAADVGLIKDIISKNNDQDGSKHVDWKTLYPYADANCDGKVDSKDVDLAQSLVERKKGTTVFYLDGNGESKSVEYPIRSICVLGTATFTAAQSLGLSDIVYGRSGTAQTNDVIYKDIWSKPAVSSSMIDFDLSLFSNVSDKVAGGIDAVVQNNGGMGAPIKAETAAELEKLGTSTLTMKFDVKGEENYYLTLGFLCDAEDESHKVVGIIDGVYSKVKAAAEKAGKKPSVLCCWVTGSMGTGMYASSAASVAAFVSAAGGDLIQIPDDSMDISENTVGILDDKYDGNYILAPVRTSVSYLDSKDSWKPVWENATGSSSTLHQMTACPDDTYLLMYGMPFICKVAYSAEILYKGSVGEGYGDGINQKWVEMCYIKNLGSGYKVSEHGFCIGSKDFGGSSDPDKTATSISMFEDSVELKAGETKTLSYVTSPAGSKASGSTYWSTSDPSVATVDAGTVTAVSPGTAKISLKIGSLSTECAVKVVGDEEEEGHGKTVIGVGADKIAASFVATYNGPYGKYAVDPSATSERATATCTSGSRTMTIVFEGNTEAKAMFEEAVASGTIEAPLGMPGEKTTEVKYESGLDGFKAYAHEASSMARFTALKLAAYEGDVFVDGFTSWQYRPSDLATDSETEALLNAISIVLTGSEGRMATDGPAALVLSSKALQLVSGQNAELAVSAMPPTAALPLPVVWSTSDAKVATVDEGKVLAVGEGTAIVKASAGGLSAECTVKVSAAAEKGADKMAAAFVSAYSKASAFGTMGLAEGATGASATATFDTGSKVAPITNVVFIGCDDASARFEAAKSAIDAAVAETGMTARDVPSIPALDGLYGKMVDMSMGTMSFTMLYFAAYDGGVYVDGFSTYQLHRGSLATDDEAKAFFDALAGSMQAS